MLVTDRPLNEQEMSAAMVLIMEGGADEAEVAAFLKALAGRGETADEITGAARVIREKAHTITAPHNAVDCCGTGGDGAHTYNISTAVALIAAACGVPVAKHGNRASSSKSGAADVLEALGVNPDIAPAQAEIALKRFNFAFLMAQRHHPAMKRVAAIRKSIGARTIFNLLGPLANPAGTKRQLIGVSDRKYMLPMAEALLRLGTEAAWIVHGTDGLDEVTLTAPTLVAALDGGRIIQRSVSPDDFDLPARRPEELRGGDAQQNAKALNDLLHGKPGAYRDIALANTAAVLMVQGRIASLKTGVRMAADAVDSGSAARLLDNYRLFSREAEAA